MSSSPPSPKLVWLGTGFEELDKIIGHELGRVAQLVEQGVAKRERQANRPADERDADDDDSGSRRAPRVPTS